MSADHALRTPIRYLLRRSKTMLSAPKRGMACTATFSDTFSGAGFNER